MTLDDPAVVRAEYSDEQGLEGRMAADRFASGPQPREVAYAAIEEVRPLQALPFPDGSSEPARVLRPAGRFVAVTNSHDHLRELRELAGAERPQWAYSAENGEELLRASFGRVERRDAYGWIDFPGRDEVRAYLRASRSLWNVGDVDELPLSGPFRVRRAPVVFVAER